MMRYMHVARTVLASLLVLLAFSAQAQGDAQDHEQLRRLLSETRDAVNTGRFEALQPLFYKTFSATMINQDLLTKPEEVQAYFDKWFKGDKAFIKKLTMDPQADALTQIYDGKYGIARGSNTEVYDLANGKAYTLKTRWTAMLIKDAEQWKILAIHNGTNFLDNPIFAAAERAAYYFAAGGALVGLIIGFLLGRRKRA